MKITKRFPLIALATLVLAVAIPTGIALAAKNDAAPTTVHACLKSDGTTIDPATITVNASAACTAPETLTSWNVTGTVGPKGDTGATGAQGLVGPKGDKGDTGATGATGPKGDTGAQGNQGNQGNPGPVGPKGDTGAAGKDGAVGPAGPVGPQGTQGATGVAGPKGDTGAQGVPGVSGYTVVYSPNVTLNPGQVESANCPTGDMAIGGGVQLGTTNGNFAISLNRISVPHHAWQGAYSSNNGKKTAIQVSVICAAA